MNEPFIGPSSSLRDLTRFITLKQDDWTMLIAEYGQQHVEVNEWELYDVLTVLSGQMHYDFFQRSEGSAVFMRSDNNLMSPGMLPGNRCFIVKGLAFCVRAKDRERWEMLAPTAHVEFTVSDKIYRVTSADLVPVMDTGMPIYRKVTREWRSPGRSMQRIVEEESVRGWLPFDPPILILPVRPFRLGLHFMPTPYPTRPINVRAVLSGWDIRIAW